MQLHPLSNYPNPTNVTVNLGDGDIIIPAAAPDRLYERFLLMDDLENFYAIPRKAVSNGAGAYDILLPFTETLANPNWHNFRRRLFLNTKNPTDGVSAGQRKFIPVNRPVGHKAYLSNVSYAAYDYNEMIPLCALYDEFIASKIVPDAFGTGIKGFKIKTAVSNATDLMLVPKSSYFTTAHYPAYQEQIQRRQDELLTMEILGQGAPRSSVRGGMLPGDFLMNNFWLNLKGFTAATPDFDAPGSTYTNIWQSPEENSSYNVNRDLENTDSSGKTDMFIPGINNEMDLLIPDDVKWICVDVAGAGWRHGLFEMSEMVPDSSYKKILRGEGSTLGNMWTYVQMPVKVQIDIRYHEVA